MQRRCGTRLWRWRNCKRRKNLYMYVYRSLHIPTTPQTALPPAPLTQGSLTRYAANLQPFSHLSVPAPLTQGSLTKFAQTLFSSTDQRLPCVSRRKLPCSGGVGTACGDGGIVNDCICCVIINKCKPTTPQTALPPALPRHAYVCHRHYSGALTQGSLTESLHRR